MCDSGIGHSGIGHSGIGHSGIGHSGVGHTHVVSVYTQVFHWHTAAAPLSSRV